MIRETSKEALASIKDLGHRRTQVYSIIQQLGQACNLDIAQELHMPINSITPRTNELVKMGYVEKSHIAPNRFTGKKVIYWKLRAKEKQLTLFELVASTPQVYKNDYE